MAPFVQYQVCASRQMSGLTTEDYMEPRWQLKKDVIHNVAVLKELISISQFPYFQPIYITISLFNFENGTDYYRRCDASFLYPYYMYIRGAGIFGARVPKRLQSL